MRNKLLLLTLLEGGLVMLLETASPIVVAPVMGHSVMIWAMMLCLSIGSLALGYFLGGWFTKKTKSYAFVMSLFLINAFVITIGALLLQVQNSSTTDLVTSGFSILVITFLLIIPLILFGSSTPVIVYLIADQKTKDSSSAGNVFSISTVGGIIFSLLTGYYLIDSYGVSATVLFAVLLCVLFPLIHFVRIKRWVHSGIGALILISALILINRKTALPESDNFKVHHFSEGITGQLVVVDFVEDNELNRILLINRMGQTRINLKTNYSSWSYVNFLTSAASLYPEGSKTLVLGLGGGIIPNQIKHYLKHDVEAVELDERIIELSDQYFDELNANVRKTADDARRFVKSSEKKYDFIILDIFNGEIMPSHGLSKEAFEDIDRILKPGGLIAINFNGFLTGKEGLAGRSVIKTLKSAGFNVNVFDCSLGDGKESERNLLYFAYKKAPDWSKQKVHTIIEGKEIYIGRNFMDLKSIDKKDAFLVTDDKPVMEYINRYAAASWRKAYFENYTKRFKKDHKLPLVL